MQYWVSVIFCLLVTIFSVEPAYAVATAQPISTAATSSSMVRRVGGFLVAGALLEALARGEQSAVRARVKALWRHMKEHKWKWLLGLTVLGIAIKQLKRHAPRLPMSLTVQVPDTVAPPVETPQITFSGYCDAYDVVRARACTPRSWASSMELYPPKGADPDFWCRIFHQPANDGEAGLARCLVTEEATISLRSYKVALGKSWPAWADHQVKYIGKGSVKDATIKFVEESPLFLSVDVGRPGHFLLGYSNKDKTWYHFSVGSRGHVEVKITTSLDQHRRNLVFENACLKTPARKKRRNSLPFASPEVIDPDYLLPPDKANEVAQMHAVVWNSLAPRPPVRPRSR